MRRFAEAVVLGLETDSQIEDKIGEKVICSGELRQGRTPSAGNIVSVSTLFDVLRPRRSKLLPRRSVIALTAEGVHVSSHSGCQTATGPTTVGGTLHIGGEAIPAFRPQLNERDSGISELFRLLGTEG